VSTRIPDTGDGGAPILGEPLPIELLNTRYAVRGVPHEGLRDPAHLAAWLGEIAARLAVEPTAADLRAVDAADLAAVVDLRACVGAVVTAATAGTAPAEAAIDGLNGYVRAAPQWRELRWAPAPTAVAYTAAGPIAAALGQIAAAAVELVTGARRTELRPCQGPGCILHFVRDNPRREWCSAACGNRARVARHYRRAKTAAAR
jgi:predicted RNA-binding Zn ribbon-like protein